MSLAEAAALVGSEARLLDDQDFTGWIALFTEDCRYRVPVDPSQDDPAAGLSHFHDDRQIMEARTHRLMNPRAFGGEPTPRTCHVVSGVRIDRDEGDTLHVSSSQIMLEYRARGRFEADTRAFGGRVRHVLRRTADGWRIAEKRVDLINAGGAFNAMLAPL